MNRPLLPPALAFASGILANEFLGLAPPWWIAVALGFLAASAAPQRGRIACLWAGWVAAGALAHSIHSTPLSPVDLRRLTGPEPILVELRGVITETPSLRLRERRGQWTGRTLVTLEVTAWRPLDGTWAPASGNVMTTTQGSFPEDLYRGRSVTVSGVLREPPGAPAPGLFDYRSHLRHLDIARTLDVSRVEDWVPEDPGNARPPLSERFLPWARAALSNGLPDDEATRLLWAMTLGWRTALSGDVDTAFLESGTLHVFAISGLHIALIATLLVAVLRAVRIPRAATAVLILPTLWFYVAATGWQPSAVRSGWMMSVVAGTWVLHRPSDVLNSLALAALLLLLVQPGQLLQAGFQLSFGVVAGLAILVPLLEPRILRGLRFHADPFLPDPLRPRWQHWLEAPARWLATSLATGIAAFLCSLPVTVHAFHLFSPVSVLANLAVVPISGLALSANAASLLVTPVWPDLAAVFNASAWLWMQSMVMLSQGFARIPAGVWYVAPPPWPWWIVYMGVVLGVATGHLAPGPGPRWRWIRGTSIVLGLVGVAQVADECRTTTLTLLPGGDAVVVDAPGRRHDLVLNTGGVSSGPGLVTPFLHAHGWNQVPTLVLANADTLHLGGAPEFLRRFVPDEVLVSNGSQRSPALRTALKASEDLGIRTRTLRVGDRIAGWTVLGPPALGSARTQDDAAPVLAGTVGGIRILLIPGSGRKAQRALLADPGAADALEADLVIAGLPRDHDPLIPELLAATRARQLVILSAPSPAPQRLRPELRERLSEAGIPVLFTGDVGTVSVEIGPGRVRLHLGDGSTHSLPSPRSF